MDRDFEQVFQQIISIRVKTLSNTNLAASGHIKREKNSLPVDVRRSRGRLTTNLFRQDKTKQCFIWSLIQSYVYRLYPNNLKL